MAFVIRGNQIANLKLTEQEATSKRAEAETETRTSRFWSTVYDAKANTADDSEPGQVARILNELERVKVDMPKTQKAANAYRDILTAYLVRTDLDVSHANVIQTKLRLWLVP